MGYKSINIPVFNPAFRVEILPNGGVCLLSETNQFILTGSVYSVIAPYINGENSIENIIDILIEKHNAQTMLAEAYYAFNVMAKTNCIKEADSVYSQNPEFWHLLNPDFCATPEEKITYTASIVSYCHTPLLAEQLSVLISEHKILNLSEKADLKIVLTDDYLDTRLLDINTACIKSGQPWIVIKPTGKLLWIGPVFIPNVTGCLECLRHRIKSNREIEMFVREKLENTNIFDGLCASLPSTINTGLNIAATEIAKWFVYKRKNPLIEESIITFDVAAMQTQQHILTKRPQCSCCGNDKDNKPKVIELISRKKYFDDGGHRSCSPEDILKKYGRHISPITGIVNTLSRVTDSGSMIHSYHAGHNTALNYENVFLLKKGLRSKAGGKGKTDILAKVSGLCEAIERYSGVFQGTEYRITKSFKELGKEAIHPNSCMLFSETQYNNRETWNQIAGSFHSVPNPFDENAKIEWSLAYSLHNKNFKYLPTAYCYYSYSRNKKDFYCWADSNGNASGNTIEEAILQGFFELVERDCVSIWWYNRIKRPMVDIESLNDPYFTTLKNYYKELNREIWVIDITNDLGIPSFAAITRRTDKSVEDILLGFGCHFDPKIALLRAVTEVNQFMPAVMDITKESDEYKFEDKDVLHWWKTATIENQPYLIPDTNLGIKKLSDYGYNYNNDLLDDLHRAIEIVQSKGLEMFVLNQTRPDVEMPVAKVIIPGIRHFWARFAPGRLYDVPVQLGWLKKPLEEDELNPIPMFI